MQGPRDSSRVGTASVSSMESRHLRLVFTRACFALPAIVLTFGLTACGGDDDADEPTSDEVTVTQEPDAAADPDPALFPEPKGRSLQEVADLARPGSTVAPATSQFVPGTNRFAFGVVNEGGSFIYGATAVYYAASPGKPAKGPLLAPADSLVTEPRFRSEQAVAEGDSVSSIYSTELELPRAGSYDLLVLTSLDGELFGAISSLKASDRVSVSEVGEPAPDTETDTLEDSGGQISDIDTRQPPDDMHEADLSEVLGEKPVALLFATPQLCSSRVCGPVTDIALQLKEKYGDEIEFIHQEVYVDNDANKGLRPPLEAFGLTTEPWLFTIDANGEIAARLEGSFGVTEFEEALEAALKPA